ncbi:uncharacterized protein LOC118742911 [Rhagoletis pomonella]|uniref:uncharacterized protein LOC118742911 n=1 Tax=Rhagoletis pomonella TaxID=28610 RepID=UPI0017853227|nr:uncharacterized protein LOC118742911 [Rhagoletis pomonella]
MLWKYLKTTAVRNATREARNQFSTSTCLRLKSLYSHKGTYRSMQLAAVKKICDIAAEKSSSLVTSWPFGFTGFLTATNKRTNKQPDILIVSGQTVRLKNVGSILQQQNSEHRRHMHTLCTIHLTAVGITTNNACRQPVLHAQRNSPTTAEGYSFLYSKLSTLKRQRLKRRQLKASTAAGTASVTELVNEEENQPPAASQS